MFWRGATATAPYRQEKKGNATVENQDEKVRGPRRSFLTGKRATITIAVVEKLVIFLSIINNKIIVKKMAYLCAT